jgi:hypothetical protein
MVDDYRTQTHRIIAETWYAHVFQGFESFQIMLCPPITCDRPLAGFLQPRILSLIQGSVRPDAISTSHWAETDEESWFRSNQVTSARLENDAEFARLSNELAAMIRPRSHGSPASRLPVGSPMPHFDSSDPYIKCNDRGIFRLSIGSLLPFYSLTSATFPSSSNPCRL